MFMKNKNRFTSYSEAFKRLDLLKGQEELQEATKYVLKQAAPPQAEAPAPAPSPAPEDAMSTPPSDEELPIAPEGEELPMDDMGDMEGMDDMGGEPSEGGEGEPTTFKSIQKLTGKLAQKIRDYSGEDELSSKDVKYVINSILSSLDLNSLDEDDKEEILTRFDGEEESDYGMEDMGSEEDDVDIDTEIDLDTEEEPAPEEMGEGWMDEMEFKEENFVNSALQTIFNESTIEKVLKGYVVISENEKKFLKDKKKTQKTISESRKVRYSKEIERLSITEEQKEISNRIVENFPFITFVGKTNKGNLVFENKNKQLKVSPEGNIL